MTAFTVTPNEARTNPGSPNAKKLTGIP